MGKFNTISTATIAYVTAIGVGGAIATYLSEVLGLHPLKIIFILLIYILSVISFILWFGGKLK